MGPATKGRSLTGAATVVALIVAAAALAGCGSSPARPAPTVPVVQAAAAPVITAPLWPQAAWISVPVATLWDKPGLARPVDAPEVAARPDVGKWLAAMDYDQRLDLDNRLATQALLDEKVSVIGETGPWAHVVLPSQVGSVYPTGVAAWMPVSQLTFRPLAATPQVATVSVPTARVGALTVSYGTELPVVSAGSGGVAVDTAAGRAVVAPADVRFETLPARGAAAGEAVVREAERFLGLPYLWAGTSAFGFDCSGLTYTVYRQFGITLPRDAADQAAAGRVVPRGDMRPGDLVFFDFGQGVDHVGIYAGGGMMVDSPKTGSKLELIDLWHSPLAPYFAGARRYLPG